MIIVTGGAGFIGSNIVKGLNELGRKDILVVDHLGKTDKYKNLMGLEFYDYVDKMEFIQALEEGHFDEITDAIVHMGACSSTTEMDVDYLIENNYRYTQNLAQWCTAKEVRFIYASSAATYGDGAEGYSDKAELKSMRPLNPYGFSKSQFDIWAEGEGILDSIVGLKFFNVYGPNERHKKDMRSVISKAYDQIKEVGQVKLFKSHRPDYKDGEQLRDFVYVKDAVDMVMFFLENKQIGGIFNVGTGQARSFKDLVTATFTAMGKEPNIEYIDMPEELQPRYQYFTEADMAKIKEAGYNKPATSLEDGVKDYVQSYLAKGN